jgi:uncharacterized protein YunC (DUF1805 family)
METITRSYKTSNGLVEGIQVKWTGFSILMVTGKKGFLVCGVFDIDAIDRFNMAAAMVESTPDNPIGSLERFPNRKISKVNMKARELGITEGMEVTKAFELIA